MSFSLLSVAVLCTSAAIIYKEIKKGYKYGLTKSLVRMALLIVCGIFSTAVSVLLADFLGALLFQSVRKIATLQKVAMSAPLIIGACELLMKMLLSLLLYLPVFYVLRFLCNRLIGIALKIMSKKDKKAKNEPRYLSEETPFLIIHDKKLGASVGILCGLILSVIVFMPLTSLLDAADDVALIVIEATEKEEIKEHEGIKLLHYYATDVSCTAIQACGGQALFELTARASFEGGTTTLNKEIGIIRSVDIANTVKNFRGENSITTESVDKFEGLLDTVKQSLLLRMVVSDFMAEASVQWMSYQPYLGVERPNLGENKAVEEFFNSVLYVCSTTTIDTYDANIRTVIGLIRIFEEYEFLFESHDYEFFMKNFVDSDALQRIEDELYKNPHMGRMRLFIDTLVMDMISSEIIGSQYTSEQREAFCFGIASALSDAQGLTGSVQMTAVANSVAERFADHGIYLPKNIENRVAEILIANIPVNEVVTAEDVENIFNEYISENVK